MGHNWGGWTYTMPNQPLRIGKGASLGGNFTGKLDDIGVWNRPLTASEVAAMVSIKKRLHKCYGLQVRRTTVFGLLKSNLSILG